MLESPIFFNSPGQIKCNGPLLPSFFHHWDGNVAFFHHFPAYLELFESLLAREVVHEVEHQVFEDHAQSAGSYLTLKGLARDRPRGVVAELEPDILELK